MEINEKHADRSESIISAINYAPNESYPMITLDIRRPQKYSNMVTFILIPYATSSDDELEWNISYNPLGSGK